MVIVFGELSMPFQASSCSKGRKKLKFHEKPASEKDHSNHHPERRGPCFCKIVIASLTICSILSIMLTCFLCLFCKQWYYYGKDPQISIQRVLFLKIQLALQEADVPYFNISVATLFQNLGQSIEVFYFEVLFIIMKQYSIE